ncbi:MAG: type II toxin-antitoxin system VapC family toxin [Planctomycetes bacterium]|nr:type II toxin-antitoxin system VapC family toxin [Planctomycetota bacterium]
MRILLDTHAFLWWDHDQKKLSLNARTAIGDPNNALLLSVGSIWELIVKIQIGKLTLTNSVSDLVLRQHQVNGVGVLDIRKEHVLALEQMPLHHKNPFDRILIAQANVESATLVSADPIFSQYRVTVLW